MAAGLGRTWCGSCLACRSATPTKPAGAKGTNRLGAIHRVLIAESTAIPMLLLEERLLLENP